MSENVQDLTFKKLTDGGLAELGDGNDPSNLVQCGSHVFRRSKIRTEVASLCVP